MSLNQLKKVSTQPRVSSPLAKGLSRTTRRSIPKNKKSSSQSSKSEKSMVSKKNNSLFKTVLKKTVKKTDKITLSDVKIRVYKNFDFEYEFSIFFYDGNPSPQREMIKINFTLKSGESLNNILGESDFRKALYIDVSDTLLYKIKFNIIDLFNHAKKKLPGYTVEKRGRFLREITDNRRNINKTQTNRLYKRLKERNKNTKASGKKKRRKKRKK